MALYLNMVKGNLKCESSEKILPQNNTMGILDIYFLCSARIDAACMKDDVLGDKNQTLFQSKVFGIGTEIWKIKKKKNPTKQTKPPNKTKTPKKM